MLGFFFGGEFKSHTRVFKCPSFFSFFLEYCGIFLIRRPLVSFFGFQDIALSSFAVSLLFLCFQRYLSRLQTGVHSFVKSLCGGIYFPVMLFLSFDQPFWFFASASSSVSYSP